MSIPKYSDAELTNIHEGIVRHKKKKMSSINYNRWKLEEMRIAHKMFVHRDKLDDYEDQAERETMDLYRKEAIEWMEWQIEWAGV